MTKFTNMHQLINTILIMSASSESLTILVKDLKPEQSKPAENLKEEEKASLLPTMVVVKNGNNDSREGWDEIIKGNQKATSSRKVTGTILSVIYNQKLTTSRHDNILTKSTPTTNPKKMEKKKKNRPKLTS